jgi:hypothetical protein
MLYHQTFNVMDGTVGSQKVIKVVRLVSATHHSEMAMASLVFRSRNPSFRASRKTFESGLTKGTIHTITFQTTKPTVKHQTLKKA